MLCQVTLTSCVGPKDAFRVHTELTCPYCLVEAVPSHHSTLEQ